MFHRVIITNRLFSLIRLGMCVLAAMAMTTGAVPVLAGDLTFGYGGAAPWFSQSLVTHDGIDAQQSGSISDGQVSWMETTVSGPGAIRFWWKVSSEACCDPLDFRIDGIMQANIRGEVEWQSRAFVVPAGSHTLRWNYSSDGSILAGSNAGWIDQITYSQGSGVDVTPPVTSASPAGGTYPAPQNVTLTASEPATIYYTTDGSAPTTSSARYTAPIQISVPTTLKYFAVDASGLYETAKTETYSFDNDPPVTNASLPAGSYSGARDVALFCSDNRLGCAATYYCLGSGCTAATPYSSAIAITSSTDLRFFSTDRGGNSETVKTIAYTITPDSTPPVTTHNPPGGTYGQLYVYLYCSDGNGSGSGCESTYYCLGSGCTPATKYAWGIQITDTSDLRYFSRDRSGNSEAVRTATYTIDKTPPVTSANPPGGSYELAPLVALDCNDGAGTGCATTYYCSGDNCSPSIRYTGPVPINSSTTLRFQSLDNAGNSEAIVSQSYVNPGQPKTITVPAMRTTIQSAIDAAYDGDTVLVAPGTYQENIDFRGKGITVTSSGGADVTIIDGNKAGSVVTIDSGENSSAIINGFTLRNGMGDIYIGGGGIKILNSSPRVTNNRIIDNLACDGPGILVDGGSPLIQGNVVSNNSRVGCSGGYGGGGILVKSSDSVRVLDNTISGNSIYGGDGGGLYLMFSDSPVVRGNMITGNMVSGITPCAEGGGIHLYGSNNVQIAQNVIKGNRAECGGGVSWHGGWDTRNSYFNNNTIVDNDSPKGSGLYTNMLESNERLYNNIVAGKPGQNAIYCENYLSGIAPFMGANIVHSSGGIAYDGICSDLNGINGNITADPGLSNPQQGYFGLMPGSPAIDAGDGTIPALPETDFGGMARLIDGNGDGTAVVDIGAYEFDPALPIAVLQGVPTDFLAVNSLALNVSGTGVVTYRYSLDGAAFSDTDISVSTPISLAGLANGQHSIVVLGKNNQGREQSLSSATVASWVVNTETTNLTFSNGGNAPWFVQPTVSRDGIAYQSGVISHNQASWMETTITGPGAIRFWWKVSSANYSDWLSFTIDEANQSAITGEVDWQYKAFTIPAGSHTLRWNYATDSNWLSSFNAGWVDQIVFEQGSNVDVTPPVTVANPASMTVATPRTVTLSASKPATIYFTTDGSRPTDSSTRYTTPITITGTTTLRFFAVDTAGNYEQPKSETYTFDATPPVTFSSPSSGSYSGRRDVSLYCSDNGMGCAASYYCLGSGCTPATPYASAIAITESTDLRYFSVDNGGNREAVKTQAYTIVPDVTSPVTATSISSGTYHETTLNLYCSDGDGSGCAETYYCLGTGCTPATQYKNNVYLTSTTDFRYYSIDRSGNSEAIKTASYTIDPDPPVTTASPAGGVYQAPQNVTLTCSDATGSGCSNTYYCLGSGCYPATRYSGPIAVSASTYLSFYSEDGVGNREARKSMRFNVTNAPPATITVPADRTTIQAAIDSANDGDTVIVSPGTYVENIDFKGKAITVQSSNGPDSTVIDGNQNGPVAVFSSDEWTNSILKGFTIRNGGPSQGGGGNYRGGGIYIHDASPTIDGNRIIKNRFCDAAAINSNGSPVIRNNVISDNAISEGCWGSNGGGINISGAAAQVIDNTISNNTYRNGMGGGIYAEGSGHLIRGNIIERNGGNGVDGGGINAVNATGAKILQNRINGNTARYGGGVSIGNGNELASNTIADNDGLNGSGMYSNGYSWWSNFNGLIINNVIVGKFGQTAIYVESGSNLLFRNNVVFSPSGNVYGGTLSDQNGINGNFTADPLLSGPEFGYFGLRPGSPAIDTGDGGATALPTDLNGAPRLIDGSGLGLARIDIGAYEFDPAEPRAILTGSPSGATRETSASINVSGEGIVSYRYALDGGPFGTADIPVANPVVLAGLTGGTHAVAVMGKTSSGEQRSSSATVATWTIDSIPPVTTAVPAGGSFSAPQTVTLTCSDGSGSGCAATFYCLGSDCTPTTPYSGPITIAATTGLRYFSRDSFGYQEGIKTSSYTFTGTITGHVTDGGNGAGIQDTIVIAYSATTGSAIGSCYTDGSGAYQITGLPSGAYKLRFSSGNYIEQWYSGKSDRAAADTVTVSAPGATAGINAVLVRSGSIAGVVTASDTGSGLQGVSVIAFNGVSGTYAGFGSTDSSGAYTISGLVAGDYKLSFDIPNESGYLDQWYSGKGNLATATTVTVANAATVNGIDVTLAKGGKITGTVTDGATGAPVPGLYVTALDAVSGAWVGYTSTDVSGGYTIVGLAGGYRLRFSGGGYVEQWYGGKASQAAANVVTVTAPATTSGINVAMVRGASITGVVTSSATGIGIQGAYVTAYDAVKGSLSGSAGCDSTGSYTLTGLAGGSYKLRFSANDYVDRWSGGKDNQASAVAVTVSAPGTATGINMGLVKGAVISGTVSDRETGAGIQNVNVGIYDAKTGVAVRFEWTDGSGSYAISGLASGSYKVWFAGSYGSGYLPQWFGDRESMSSANVVAVIAPNSVTGIDAALERGGDISGIVIDRETGKAVPGVSVNAYSLSSGQWVGAGYTDNSGIYVIGGLATGSYKLRFSANGYVERWFEDKADQNSAISVHVTAPNKTTDINVALGKGGSISGIITDRATGAGIAGVSIYAIDHETGDWAGSAQTDISGGYTIGNLAGGSYRLKINPSSGSGYFGEWYGGQDSYLCASDVTVTAPNATTGIDARLDMGGSIAGRVTDAATGSGISGVSIYLTNNSTQMVTTSSNSIVDPSGAYTIGGLASGEYTLSFSAAEYIRTTSPTVVKVSAPDQIVGVDAVLSRGGGIGGRITDRATGIGVYGVVVHAVDNQTRSWAGSSLSDWNGAFVITGLTSGSYTVSYDLSTASFSNGSGWISSGISVSTTTAAASSTQPVVASVSSSQNQGSSSNAQAYLVSFPRTISVNAPDMTTGIDFSIDRMGGIAGRVTDGITDDPLDWISVTAYDVVTGAQAGSTISNSDGSYAISGLPNGRYRVRFTSSRTLDGGYQSAWYDGGADTGVAAEIAVQAPETTYGIAARLSRGGGITGSISVTSCPGPRRVGVFAYDAAGTLAGQSRIDTINTDRFTIAALPPGNYRLLIDPQEAGFVRQWYPNRTDSASAEPVSVSAGGMTGGIDATLAVGGGSISGKVSGNSGCTFLPASVKLFDLYSGGFVAEAKTAFDGSFLVPGLPDDSYKLVITVNRIPRWYRSEGEIATYSPVVVSGGNALTGIDMSDACMHNGDIDGSGWPLTIIDALKALRIVVGLDAATPDILAHGDLAPISGGVSEPDGRIDIADALLILRGVVGLPFTAAQQ